MQSKDGEKSITLNRSVIQIRLYDCMLLSSQTVILITHQSPRDRGSLPAQIQVTFFMFPLTLTLPGPSAGMSGSLDSYCSLKPLCSGTGEVVPARTSPTLLPPSPRTVLTLSCFKVSQCIVTGTVRVNSINWF